MIMTTKKTLVLAALFGLTGAAYSQLTTLPPSSLDEGIAVSPIGSNAGPTHWNNPAGLGAFALRADGTIPLSTMGLTWGAAPPAAAVAASNAIAANGGVIRGIFLGESAGWLNDFGYTRSGNPAGPNSFTLFSDIQSMGPAPTVRFGDYVDIPLAFGQAANFDFWLNATGDFSPGPTSPLNPNGGVYTAFDSTRGSTTMNGAGALWAQSPVLANTWSPALNAYADVFTYLVSFEDWRPDRGSDRDMSDFLFAVQFFLPDGTPLAPELGAVPEPSTYGLLAAFALAGGAIIARRRRSLNAAVR